MKDILFLSVLMFLFAIEYVNTQIPTVVNNTKVYQSVQPTWLTSPYFKAGNRAVINTLTGSSSTPTYTFTFSSSFTNIPNLAYGIKNYRGNDYLIQQFYQIKKTDLTSNTFTVSIQIFGITNLWLLNVAYLAIEPTFPHHFNTFDNVPLNYSAGNIVNITTASLYLKYYTNYINYTSQSLNRVYKYFSPSPLNNYKIVLFMTSLWIRSQSSYEVKLHIDYNILNSSFYLLNCTTYWNMLITNLHFSQIVFDQLDIVSSNKYQVLYIEWINTNISAFMAIPYEFVDNFIMGVTDFQAIKGQCGFQYQWEFTNSSGSHGITLLQSKTKNNKCGFSWIRSSVLYISTWLCNPAYPYFNSTNITCQDLCGGYYYEGFNTSINESVCLPCDNNCYQCRPQNNTQCFQCDSTKNYVLNGNQCQCLPSYFQVNQDCFSCQTYITGCIQCFYNITINSTFDSSLLRCLNCNQTLNFLNFNNSCIYCNGSCLLLCGNGIVNFGEACDDGNMMSGDGCSINCTIQEKLEIKSINRLIHQCNTLQFSFYLQQIPSFINNINFSMLLQTNNHKIISTGFYLANSILNIRYEYHENLYNQNITFSYNYDYLNTINSSYSFYFTPKTSFIYSDNNINLNYIDQSTCKAKQNYLSLYSNIQYFAYAGLLLSILPAKIVGLQMFGVLQIAYFSVGSLDNVNLMMVGLMNMKNVNGLSIPFVKSSNSPLPKRMKSIGYFPSFLDNMNIMAVLIFVILAISIFGFILSKIINLTINYSNFFKKLSKEILLTLVFFNCFNISYSTAVHFKFNPLLQGDLASTFVSILIVSIVCLMVIAILFTEEEGFGQYKDKFRSNSFSKNYIAISLTYRFALGFILAYENQKNSSVGYGVWICTAFFMLNVVILPFNQLYHNLRACVCHFSSLGIVFVSMYYRNLSNQSQQLASQTYEPAIMVLVFILITLIINTFVLLYDSYLMIKNYLKSWKNKPLKEEMVIQNKQNQKLNQNANSISVISVNLFEQVIQ